MWLGRIGKLREQDSSLREGLGEVVLPVRALAGAVIAPATPPPLATGLCSACRYGALRGVRR